MRLAAIASALSILTLATTAKAAPINYGDFLGAGVGAADFLDVTEDSGTDMTPLFQAPFAGSNSLDFVPFAFASFASNGASDSTIATLSMRIRADAGFQIGRIIIDETADTTMSGVGTNATFSSIGTAVSVEDLNPGLAGTLNDDVLFAPGSLFELPPAIFADIHGNLILDLTAFGITEVNLTITHSLLTGSEAGTTSFIQSKTFGIDVESVTIPEPTTLAMMGIAGLVSLRRRRR
jgi:PEP-CTERM motif